MKYKSIVLVILLTALIGCSTPRSQHAYRGKMTHTQIQQRLDRADRVSDKGKWDGMRRRQGTKEKE